MVYFLGRKTPFALRTRRLINLKRNVPIMRAQSGSQTQHEQPETFTYAQRTLALRYLCSHTHTTYIFYSLDGGSSSERDRAHLPVHTSAHHLQTISAQRIASHLHRQSRTSVRSIHATIQWHPFPFHALILLLCLLIKIILKTYTTREFLQTPTPQFVRPSGTYRRAYPSCESPIKSDAVSVAVRTRV